SFVMSIMHSHSSYSSLTPSILATIISFKSSSSSFSHNATATSISYTLSLHDALPIFICPKEVLPILCGSIPPSLPSAFYWHCLRSEEHTSELQSRFELVCRLLLEKNK